MVAEHQTKSIRDFPAYLHWTPRVDQPERYDMQTAFYESLGGGVQILLGGNGSGTTTTLLAKVARFIYETPPPRKDCPFWIIAKSYDQVTKTCWKEKLYGQGHILDRDIDWNRASWYKSKERLPFAIPLKPDAKGNNWMLEFKSYEQGIGQMMAQSIGGFAFVEQFPWGILEEVLRGCREYNFPGSKLVEYTPVDPDLSLEMEEMVTNGPEPTTGKQPGLRYLPKNWKIYYANTQCAMEAGHVDKEWFEEFFGMVAPDMIDTRMKGLFPSFEGVIYKQFHPATHCMGDEMWARIKNCEHRRGIDWGAGMHNAFACVWAARNSLGQYFVYDEYNSTDQMKNTIEHLRCISEQWDWPYETNNKYGVTWCDPADPDNLRIAQQMAKYTNGEVQNMSIMKGRNAVTEGIEHIKYLLKPQIPVPVHDEHGKPVIDPLTGKVKIHLEPKLFIHRGNCPKLVQQFRTYRYLRAPKAGGVNPRDPAPEPLKKDDHLCFTADAPVLMADGTTKPICEINVGDLVVSHLGVAKVECKANHISGDLVSFWGDSRIITCTATHPWYNMTHGVYCPVSDGVTLCKLSSTPIDLERSSKLYSGKENNFSDIQIPAIMESPTTSGDQPEKEQRENCNTSGCIKKSGSRCMETFRPAMTSTTVTGTLATITSTTCKPCQNESMACSTWPTWRKQQRKLRNGILLKKDANGTANTLKPSQQQQPPSPKPATNAASSMKQKPEGNASNSAATIAEQQHDANGAMTMKYASAKSVEDRLRQIDTLRSLPVHFNVEKFTVREVRKQDGQKRVYNLATSHGTFFVDGLLTSNCDALRYMVFSEDHMHGATFESVKSHSSINDQLAGHYLPGGTSKGYSTQHRNNRR